MIQIPGLIDPHVHMRVPGGAHKEDWYSGSRAALAGGFTMLLAMPNTSPPITDAAGLDAVLAEAAAQSVVDFGHYVGGGTGNVDQISEAAHKAAGLKLYLDQTYGPLRLDDPAAQLGFLQNWTLHAPLAVHAEGETLAGFLKLVEQVRRPVHICHVANRADMLAVKAAKAAGLPVTCEVTAHHLFLTADDLAHLPFGFTEVRPRLGSKKDQQALWENMDIIDCFASDHAPHTVSEKEGQNPPPGFPGLETSLPLFLTAVTEGRLTMDDLIERAYSNPRRIFNLPKQPNTWLEIDPAQKWEISTEKLYSRSAWTPFESYPVTGAVKRVVFYGQEAFKDGQILAHPGCGHAVVPERSSSVN